MPFVARGQPGRPIDLVALDQEVRTRITRLLKDQVGLTESQIARVQDIHAKIEERRKAFNLQERQARTGLFQEVIVGDTSRNAAIGQLMDQLLKAQRERLLLNEEEQKQLSQFLTPMQRAKYFALEENLRRIVRQMMEAADSAAASHGGRGRGAVPPVAMRQMRMRAWIQPGA
ncbi:MAG TPA: Spy/CpxP family protein refolding chaperone [Gemmatimonadaceae bacterium]|nr:Spy/CpxP family protein refolding chaperone [Gemmatimonadaceae bacterium]